MAKRGDKSVDNNGTRRYPFERERRQNAFGVVECYANLAARNLLPPGATPVVIVYQEGTDHEPFTMQIAEFERLPKL